MTLAAWVELITLALKFPEEIQKLVKLFSKTPAQKRSDLIKAMQSESEKLSQTGRPEW